MSRWKGPGPAMITNGPIPDDATITRVIEAEWDGRPCLITRYVTHYGQLKARMDWVDELDSRPDSVANYLRTTPLIERQRA